MKNLKFIAAFFLFLFFYNISYSQTVWSTRFLSNQGISDLRRIQFVNSLTGFSCGSAGVLIKTTNAGDTWTKINLGTNEFLTTLFFINENTGWIGGVNAFIRKTTDAGNTWTQQPIPTTDFTASIYFIDGQIGFATSHDGKIIKTLNGGTNWITLASTGLLYGEIQFINSLTGWVLAPGYMAKTTNGGDTWDRKIYSGELLQDMIFIDSQTGWITDINSILKTTNGGENWSINSIPMTTPMSMKIINSNILWCAGYSGNNGVICRSLNGGINWTIQNTVPNNLFWGISFANANTGWASGYAQISNTNNGNLVSVIPVSIKTPDEYSLKQNYPNPFNPATSIKFDLKKSGFVSLKIFSMSGAEVKSLVNENIIAGSYEVSFNAENLPSGTYFYTLETYDFKETKKMMLVK
jgi:photosystem II stability/assembly factor-like uncharacterized protein